jgi:hypothetical protein
VTEQTVERESTSPSKKRLKLVLITFGVVLGAFAVLYLLTENQHTAPFVYAIF